MYLPAFPEIARHFSVEVSRVELSLASFFIGLSIGQLFYGVLSDRYGRKRPLYFGVSLFVVATIICALSTSVEGLIAARFFQALGACSGMVISRAMVRDLYSPQETARIFSLLVLVMGAAPILAPLLGSYLLQVANWQAMFWTVAGFAALIGVALIRGLPESKTPNPEVRLGRAISTYRELLQDKKFMKNALAGGLAQAGMFAYITGSPYVLIELFHLSPQSYGWVFGTNALGLILSSQINARIARHRSPEQVLTLMLKWIALSGIALAVVSHFEVRLEVFLIPLFGYVAALGFIFPNSTAGALADQPHRAGAASALLGTLQFFLGTIAATTLSILHAESARPMSLIVGTCGALAFLSHRFIDTQKNPH